VFRWKALLDVVQLLVFVDIDEDAAFDRVEQPRPLDLARLEDDVAVGEDDRWAPLGEVIDRVERPREEPVRERVIHEERGQAEHVGIARVLDAVALECPKVVGVAELGTERFENRPVPFLTIRSDLVGEVALEIGRDAVVVEQRVVDVEQTHNPVPGLGWGRHHVVNSVLSSAAAGTAL